jgi:hypothetical protein
MRSIALAAALLAGIALLAVPAAAHERETTHEGHGVIVVEGRHPVSPGAIRYVVRVTWSADQHPATDANVMATAISPVGISSTPVVLQPLDYDGRYGGTVALPSDGAWTVRLTSATPPGIADISEQVLLH